MFLKNAQIIQISLGKTFNGRNHKQYTRTPEPRNWIHRRAEAVSVFETNKTGTLEEQT